MKKYLLALFLCACAFLTLACSKEEPQKPVITLIYYSNGEVVHTQSFAEGERVYTMDAKPSREGYVFNGWYYDEGLWNQSFDPTDLNREFVAGVYKIYARYEHVSFKLNDDGKSYTVTGALAGAGEKIVIPSRYLGKPVTEIAQNAFADNKTVKEITIPDSVTKIGQYAFARCTALKSAMIPNSTNIRVGNGVFSQCTALESVNLGATLKEIPAYGFEGCTSLKEITVYQAETVLGSAFKDCTALESVTLPDSMKKICLRAFEGCTSLATVTVSVNVETIEEYAFYGCAKLENFLFKSKCGVRTIQTNAFSGTALTELSLPTLRTLGEDALPETLKSFTFGGINLLYVDARAFASLSADAVVNFGGTVKNFEDAMKDAAWSEGRLVTIVCGDGVIAP